MKRRNNNENRNLRKKKSIESLSAFFMIELRVNEITKHKTR